MATTVDTLLVRIEADMSDLKRDLSKVAQHTERSTDRMQDSFRKVGRAIAALGGAAIFGSFVKNAVNTGMQVEGLRIQLDALLGSAEEGGKAFQIMTRFASRVPFSLKQIQQGAGGLGAAAKNADELGELMQITGNIAAQFNIPFEEAAANVQRALSAGIGAADQFRDRGVSAFAGFEAGVSYSASETAKKLQETFGTGGTADGAMDQFAKTTQGAMSMLGDAMFNFQATMASSGLNEGLTTLVNVLTKIVNESRVFAAVIGSLLGSALTVLGKAVEFVVDHMKDIIYYFGLFVAMRTVMAFGESALAALKYARAVNAVSIAKKAMSIMSKRSIISLLAVAGTVAFLSDELDEFIASVGDLGERIFQDLPPNLKRFFDPVANAIDDAVDAATAAKDFMNTPFGALGTGTSIQLSDSGVDAAAMRKLTDLINANTRSTKGLNDQIKILENALAGELPDAIRQQATAALEHLREQLKETEPLYKATKDAVMDMASSMSTAFADALVEGKNAMESLKDVFKSFVKTMIAKALELYVFNHIINAVFGLSGKSALPTRTMFSAGGGTIQPNVPTVVGERGPELIVPSSGGSKVLNNMNANNAMGGGTTVVHQTINVQAGVAQTVRAEMLTLLPKFKQDTMDAVVDAKRRGGSFGQAFG